MIKYFYLIILIIVVGCGKQQEPYEEVAVEFITADAKSLNKLCSESLAKVLQDTAKQQGENVKIINKRQKGDQAVVTLTFTVGESKPNEVNIYLVKENSLWKVDEMGMMTPKGEMKIKDSMKIVKNMKNKWKNSLQPSTTKKITYISKQTVNDLEVKLTKLEKKHHYRFYFRYEPNDYTCDVSFTNLKKGSAQISQLKNQMLYTIDGETESPQKIANLNLIFTQKPSVEKASAKIEFSLNENDTLQKIDSSSKNLKISHVGVLLNKEVLPFPIPNEQYLHRVKYGNNELCVRESPQKNNWYTMVIVGSITPVKAINKQKIEDNLVILDPKAPSFKRVTGHYNISVVGDTVHFAISSTLFDKPSHDLQLCYFSPAYYQQNQKMISFDHIDVSKAKRTNQNNFPNDKDSLLATKNAGDIVVSLTGIEERLSGKLQFVYMGEKYKETVTIPNVSAKGYTMTMGKWHYIDYNLKPKSHFSETVDIYLNLNTNGSVARYKFMQIPFSAKSRKD